MMPAAVERPDARPGMVAVIQTFGSSLKWNPHIHAIVTRGVFLEDGSWLPIPCVDSHNAELLFRHKVLGLLRDRELITPKGQDRIDLLPPWRNSGFGVHNRTGAFALSRVPLRARGDGESTARAEALRRGGVAPASPLREGSHPENLYDRAEALTVAGSKEEPGKLFADFEKEARAESEGVDNANRELVFFYADRTSEPESALAIAEREFGRRKEVFTRDAYAWALHRSGKSSAARPQTEAALEVGIQAARMLYHAGAICAAVSDRDAAAKYLRESPALNPHSPAAANARESLETLEPEVAQ
jgi:hypothetical protein